MQRRLSVSPVKTRILTVPVKPKVSFVYQNQNQNQNHSPVNSRLSTHDNIQMGISNKQNNFSKIDNALQKSPSRTYRYPPLSPHNNVTRITTSNNMKIPGFLKQKTSDNSPFIKELQQKEKQHLIAVSKFTGIPSKVYQLPHLPLNSGSPNSNARLSEISQISEEPEESSQFFQKSSNQMQYKAKPGVKLQETIFNISRSSHGDNSLVMSPKRSRLNDDSQNTQICSKCRKNLASYQIKASKLKLCSQCGIAELIEGSELSEVSPRSDRIISTPSARTSLVCFEEKQQLKIEQCLEEVSKEKKSLLKLYSSFQKNQGTHISNFYKNKKYKLKEHYQRIKIAIKESIEADIHELQILQQRQKFDWKSNIKKIQGDLKQLEIIEQDMTKKCEQYKYQSKIDQQSYYKMINRHRLNTSRMTNYCEQMNSQQWSDWEQKSIDTEGLCFKKQKKDSSSLYISDTYRMHSLKGKNETFMTMNMNNQSNRGVLFSFEGTKQ